MAITTELVGKLGGTSVEKVSIDWTQPDWTTTEKVAYSLLLPAGHTYGIVVVARGASNTSTNSSPKIRLTGETSVSMISDRPVGLEKSGATGTVEVLIQRGTSTTGSAYVSDFKANLYYWRE